MEHGGYGKQSIASPRGHDRGNPRGHDRGNSEPEEIISTISFQNHDVEVDTGKIGGTYNVLSERISEHGVNSSTEGNTHRTSEHGVDYNTEENTHRTVENSNTEDRRGNMNHNTDDYTVNYDCVETNTGLPEHCEAGLVSYNDSGGYDADHQTETVDTECDHRHTYKKKKKKRRCKESCECPGGRCKDMERKRRKKERYLKKLSLKSGIDNSGFIAESVDGITENVKCTSSLPPPGLWLGQDILDNSKPTRENKYLKKHQAISKSKHSSNQEHSDSHLPAYDIFLASGLSPRVQHYTRGINLKSRSNSIDTANSVDIYKKRPGSGIHRKRRLGDLKRTSSKVSILKDESPLSSRIELDPTARTVRTHRNRDYLADSSETLLEEFPEPMWFCKVITTYPVLSFLVVTLLHLATIGATAGLVLSGYDVFPAVFDEVPLYIYNDARLKELAWKSRWSFEGAIYRPMYGFTVNTGYRSRPKDTVEIIFEKPGVNILTKQYLKWIQAAENELYQESGFQEDFCLLDYTGRCIKPQSLIRLFDGTYSNVDSAFLDTNFNNVTNVLYKASLYNETKEFLELFLSKDSVISPHRCHSSITRTVFVMGWPLSILRNGRWGTLEDLTNYLADTFKPKIEYVRDYFLVERLDVYYISKLLYEHDLIEQALKDILLAIGSVLFIFVFMCFQTGSLVLTSLGILSILSSFLLTNIFYRYVFQFKYFGFFHVISLFLILGIGADDLFVFYDTWRLTGHTKYPSDAHRMSECYRRAAKTTFVTSLTTMTAFLVSGLSPLLPVKTFGIFTGFLVAVNYIWVILYFPSIIMIHHTKTKNLWRRFRHFLLSVYLTNDVVSKNGKSSPRTDTNSPVSETNSSAELIPNTVHKSEPPKQDKNINNPSPNKCGAVSDRKQDVAVDIDTPSKVEKEDNGVKTSFVDHEKHRKEYFRQQSLKPKKNFEDRNRIVKFLRNTFFDFMTKRVVKVTIPLMFLCVSIFFIHRATMIQPDTHQLRLFRSSHNYAKATERHYNSFLRNPDDEYQRLYIVWGMLPVDISNCDQKSAEFCFGETRYDHNIDMNTETAQQGFKDLCSRLDNMDDDTINKLRIQKDSFTSKPKINCFSGPMERYFDNKFGPDLTSDPDTVKALVSANRYVFQEPLPPDFNNYFEILLSYWLTDGYQLNPTNDYVKYNEMLVERYVPGVTKDAFYTHSGIYYGGKLQYVAIEVNTTMNVYSLGYEEGLKIYEEWENFMKSLNDMMPPPFQNGIQATEHLWHWLHVQETLASSAVTGIMVGLFTAWPVLVITTMNVIIGTIATVTIGLVTACVIGLIPLAGWKLGVLESINLCMVVGLSVDYIVHLAEAYRMSKSTRRLDRVHNMLESIGLSVISGAITTMGAAMFMLFAQIQFFLQFGIFILSTVGISLLFSLLGFTTLLSLCGPENDTGSLPVLLKGFVNFCRREEDPDEEDAGSKSCRCPCAPPSELIDRVYDWLSKKTSQIPDQPKLNKRYR